MSDAIKAALDEAAKRLCFGHDGQECDMCAAPVHDVAFYEDWQTLSAAVEKAARDD